VTHLARKAGRRVCGRSCRPERAQKQGSCDNRPSELPKSTPVATTAQGIGESNSNVRISPCFMHEGLLYMI
jgi:hypothetical protein